MTHRAVIFDLDGTLIDSVDDLTAAVNAYLVPLGYSATDRTALMRRMGDGARELLQRTIIEAGHKAPTAMEMTAMAEDFSDFYDGFPHRFTVLFAGIKDALDGLRSSGYRLGVCTNKRTDLSRHLLAKVGILDRFGAIVGGDDPRFLKPNPAPLLGVLQQLDVPPAASIMVGDSVNDILIGQRVGAQTVAARYGFPRRPEELYGADAFIDRPSELPAIIRSLCA
ncbi:HAD-IA family hydrolase [Ferrovibrio sp.]|uniref:HAD-IA family hydrolase n=1 Tax=Ferrovibrio sp. TaxID=1917215 RepID=UPI0035B32B72